MGFDMQLGGKDIAVGNGIDSENGFLDEAVRRQWGVSSYADLWGEHGKVVGAAHAAMGEDGGKGKVSEAMRALDESLRHRLADMRKYDSKRTCSGACPVVLCPKCKTKARPKENCYDCKRLSCRECQKRKQHEHMEGLMRETKEALERLVQEGPLVP